MKRKHIEWAEGGKDGISTLSKGYIHDYYGAGNHFFIEDVYRYYGPEASGSHYSAVVSGPAHQIANMVVRHFMNDNVNNLSGTRSKDIVHAKGGNDVIQSAGGDDFVNGGDGDDFIMGGAGRDTLIGGAGADTFAYTHKNHFGDTIKWFDQDDKIQIAGMKRPNDKVVFEKIGHNTYKAEYHPGGPVDNLMDLLPSTLAVVHTMNGVVPNSDDNVIG